MFLGILGHDLRNPLNTIRLSATVIKRPHENDVDTVEVAEVIDESALATSGTATA